MSAVVLAAQTGEMELWNVSPGLAGFFWGFFALAVVCIPLFWSMTRHMRKVDHNARLREEAEAAERARTEGDAADGRVIEGTGRDVVRDGDSPAGPSSP